MLFFDDKKFIQTLLHDETGAAIVEMALIMPLIAFLFASAIELGFILKEYRRVNDLVQAQVLYLSASNPISTCNNGSCTTSYPSVVEQMYASSSSPSNTLLAAVATVNSQIQSADATPSVEFFCGCPTSNDANASLYTMAFASSPSYCPAPSVNTCGVGSSYYAYARVKATKKHNLFFINLSSIAKMLNLSVNWATPNITAQALVRIY